MLEQQDITIDWCHILDVLWIYWAPQTTVVACIVGHSPRVVWRYRTHVLLMKQLGEIEADGHGTERQSSDICAQGTIKSFSWNCFRISFLKKLWDIDVVFRNISEHELWLCELIGNRTLSLKWLVVKLQEGVYIHRELRRKRYGGYSGWCFQFQAVTW